MNTIKIVSAEILFRTGIYLRRYGRYRFALILCKGSCLFNNFNAGYYIAVGDIYTMLHRIADAANAYKKAYLLEDTNKRFKLKLKKAEYLRKLNKNYTLQEDITKNVFGLDNIKNINSSLIIDDRIQRYFLAKHEIKTSRDSHYIMQKAIINDGMFSNELSFYKNIIEQPSSVPVRLPYFYGASKKEHQSIFIEYIHDKASQLAVREWGDIGTYLYYVTKLNFKKMYTVGEYPIQIVTPYPGEPSKEIARRIENYLHLSQGLDHTIKMLEPKLNYAEVDEQKMLLNIFYKLQLLLKPGCIGYNAINRNYITVRHNDLNQQNLRYDGEKKVIIDWASWCFGVFGGDIITSMIIHQEDVYHTPEDIVELAEYICSKINSISSFRHDFKISLLCYYAVVLLFHDKKRAWAFKNYDTVYGRLFDYIKSTQMF